MGLFDGPKATRLPTGSNERALQELAPSLAREAGGLRSVANLFFNDLAGDQAGRRARVTGRAAASHRNIGPATSKAGVLDNAVRRGRGLSRVTQAAGQGFDTNQLRQRIAAAQFLRKRSGRGIAALKDATSNELTLAGANKGARDMASASRANIAGSALGLAAGAAFQGFQNRQPPGVEDFTESAFGVDVGAFSPPATERFA